MNNLTKSPENLVLRSTIDHKSKEKSTFMQEWVLICFKYAGINLLYISSYEDIDDLLAFVKKISSINGLEDTNEEWSALLFSTFLFMIQAKYSKKL